MGLRQQKPPDTLRSRGRVGLLKLPLSGRCALCCRRGV